jgi:hypothetical protein
MPTFRTAPSAGLAESIRRAVASGGGRLSPLQEIQADQEAAETAQRLSLAEKARFEVEQAQRAAQLRTDPMARSQFAAHAAGLDEPTGARLAAHLRGELEQPSPADIDDAAAVGREAQPFVTGAPNVTTGQRRAFQSALAATMANALATGNTNAEQLTQATGNLQTQALTEAVQAAIARGDMQAASAMSQGARPGTAIKLHENIGTTGATFAPATGAVSADTAARPGNALLAATVDQLRARAEEDRAQAGKARKEAEGGGLGKPPAGYRWGPADEEGNPTLLPVAGGPAEKLGETQMKQLVGVQNTRNAITEYRNAIKGFSRLDMLNPNARARMGTIYNNMMLQAKEAYNLGVLNGPDYMILQQVVTDPTSLKAGVISRDALDAQAAKLDEIMGRIGLTVSAASRQRGAGVPSAPQAPEATKVINGVTYRKIGGQWYSQ